MDEVVAFATNSGSSTHHTQSPKPRLNSTNPNQPQPQYYPPPNPSSTQPQSPHTILFTSPPKHSIYSSILSSIYTHPPIHRRLHAYTFNCKQIINFIYLLYISIDILTFMWYNKDNGKGAFLYVKYLTI